MTTRLIHKFIIAGCCCFISAPSLQASGRSAGAEVSQKEKREGKGGEKKRGGGIKFILKHSEELKLTDEQKDKLRKLQSEAKEKRNTRSEIPKILNKEQIEKLQALRKERREKHKKA